MRNVKQTAKEYLYIILGTFFAAAGVFFFMIHSNVILGSITGLAVVLSDILKTAVKIPVSVLTFILNVICLVIGFIFVGKEFGAKTVFSSLLLPVFLNIFEHIFPNYSSLTNDMVLDAICCIIVLSIGQAILFHTNASSGGLDIIAKVINRYLHIELGKGIAVIGILTVLTSAFCYSPKAVIVGMLGTYFNGIVLDSYIGGFNRKKRVCVLTDNEKPLMDYILQTLNRGVTLYAAKGAFGGQEKTELVTILTNSEYGKLVEYIRKNCPTAFVTVSTVNDVIGLWHIGKKKIHAKNNSEE